MFIFTPTDEQPGKLDVRVGGMKNAGSGNL
jgi:hypothetical protein